MTSRKNSEAMMSACPRLGYMINFPRGSRHAVSANISGVQKSSWAPQITSVSVWMSSSRSRTLKASSARSTAIASPDSLFSPAWRQQSRSARARP
jgi:hypothetical protein